MNAGLWGALARALLFVSFGWDVLSLLAARTAWLTDEPVVLSVTPLGAAQYVLWGVVAAVVLGPLGTQRLLRGRAVEALAIATVSGCAAEVLLTGVGVRATPAVLWVLTLRGGASLLLALVLVVRTQALSAVEAAGTPSPSPSPAGGASLFEALLRRWWHWRAARPFDWAFSLFVIGAAAGLLAEGRRQQQLERGYRALASCLARADTGCTSSALAQLTHLGPTGRRWTVAQLGARLLLSGWTPELSTELEALERQVALTAPERVDLALALGDAEVARAHADEARTWWTSVRGRGEDALIAPRLARLAEREAAAERESARSREEVAERATRAASELRASLDALWRQLDADFEAASLSARAGQVSALRVRLRLFERITAVVPGEARARFEAAVEALCEAGDAAASLERLADHARRLERSPSPFSRQDRQDVGTQQEREHRKVEELLALGRAQFDEGLTLLRGLPVEEVAPPTLRVFRLHAP